jgi:hypothetical protein
VIEDHGYCCHSEWEDYILGQHIETAKIFSNRVIFMEI